MRIVQKTFSGYRLNLPEGFTLVYVDRDGSRFVPPESIFGVEYWMKVRMKDIDPAKDGWIKI
jgi:hypothetical protein